MLEIPDLTPDLVQVILPFILIGFVAQLVDGALGMAFGVITNTVLVSVFGMPPASSSASVHLVEAFTTGASGISHLLHKNIDWRLFRRLAIPGIAGGITGAYLLSNIDGQTARPFVMAYLVIIGFYLLWRAWRMQPDHVHRQARNVAPLGLVGGFLDSVGGGGWGSVVTSNLLIQGVEPRRTIGTVNAVEFLLTVSVSLTFIATIGLSAFTLAVIGLIIGGLIAAPLGAVLAKKVPARTLLTAVALFLVATSGLSLFHSQV